MRKNIAITVLVIGIAAAGLASAEEMKDGMSGGGMMKGMMGEEMMGKAMMDGKMMGMCSMMKSMMDKSVVATSDGGIVIVQGNKVTKFDKNLNIVKEIELKMDMEGMKQDMMEMMKMCPMMGKGGMMGGMDKASDKIQNASETPSGEIDHASHH